MNLPDWFDEVEDNKIWQLTENYQTDYSGHAMTVISYDDHRYGGVFELQNSWGTDWGDGGYIWVKYQDFANFTRYAFELIGKFRNESLTLSGKLCLVRATSGEMSAALVAAT